MRDITETLVPWNAIPCRRT